MKWLAAILGTFFAELFRFLRELAATPTTAEDADVQAERRKRLIEKIRKQKRIDEARARRNHEPPTGRL